MVYTLTLLLGIVLGIPLGLTLNHRADFEHTATGYVFLDRLTAPYWRWRAKVATRRLEESVGRHLVHSPSPTRKDQ